MNLRKFTRGKYSLYIFLGLGLLIYLLERFDVFSFRELLYKIEDLPFADIIRKVSHVINAWF